MTVYWPASIKRALGSMGFAAETGPQLQQIGAQEAQSNMQAAGWQPMPEMQAAPAPSEPLAPLPEVALPSLEEATARWQEQPKPTPSGTPSAMPSNAPQTGAINTSTITQGPTGPALRPGESVGSVTLGSHPEKQAEVYRQARANGLDDEGARILVAVTETEGGLTGAVGDTHLNPRGSRGPFQFYEGGQMPGFRSWLQQQGIQGDPDVLVNDIALATRYAATTYLGRAIAAGREQGLSGAELATYVQRYGQVSEHPERTGANYQRLYGPGAQVYPERGEPVVRQNLPTAPNTPPQASDVRTYPEQRPSDPTPIPYKPQTGQKYRVRDQWGNEYEMTEDDLRTRPGGTAGLTVLGPIAMNAGSGLPAPETVPAAGAGAPPPSAPAAPDTTAMWSPDEPAQQPMAYQAAAGRGAGQGVMYRGPLGAAPAEVSNDEQTSTYQDPDTLTYPTPPSYNDPTTTGTQNAPIPAPVSPESPNPYTYQIADGRVEPPTPEGFEPWRTIPKPPPAARSPYDEEQPWRPTLTLGSPPQGPSTPPVAPNDRLDRPYDPRDADSGPRETPRYKPPETWYGRAAEAGLTAIAPALQALDAANEWLINHPVLGVANPQRMGRELAGADQMYTETHEDQQRLEALIRRYRAGDTSVEPEIQALTASLNRRTSGGTAGLLAAGERNPDKGAETAGQVAQAALTFGIAPSLGAGPVRNVVAAAMDPVGQTLGAIPDAAGSLVRGARGAGRMVREGGEAAAARTVPAGEMQLGSGFVPTMSDARNAAQGAFVGGAAPDFLAGEDDPELTPAERLARIGAGAALGVAAGRRMRPGAAGSRLGSGVVPDNASRLKPPGFEDVGMGRGRSLETPTTELNYQGRTLAVEATGDPSAPFLLRGTRGQPLTLVPMPAENSSAYYVSRGPGRYDAGFIGQLGDGSLMWVPNSGPQAPAAKKTWYAYLKEKGAAEIAYIRQRDGITPHQSSSDGWGSSRPLNAAAPAALGAGAGTELDEDGNPVGYDPAKGMAGMVAAGVGNSKAGRELAAKLASDASKVAAAAKAGPQHGAKLNRAIQPAESSVPLSVRLANSLTDDRAAMRWGENQLSDAAGAPRLPENSAARPSTQTRVNPDSMSAARIEDDLVTTVAQAEKEGLLDEVSQHLEDMHSFDVLVNTHQRAATAAREAAEQANTAVSARVEAARTQGQERVAKLQQQADERISAMREAGKKPEAIAKAEQVYATRIARAQEQADARVAALTRSRDAETEANAAGDQAMRQWARENGTTPEAIVERLEGQRQRLEASGQGTRVSELAQRVWDHNRQTFQNAVDAGRMTPEQAQRLADEYPHYVPTQPLSELLPDGTGGMTAGSPRAGRVAADTSNPVEAFDAAGSGRGKRGERLNPIIASRNATIVRERQAQQNRVFTRFYEMITAAEAADDALPSASTGPRPNRLAGEIEVSGWVNGEKRSIRVPKPIADMLDAASQAGNPDAAMSFWGRVKNVVTQTITSRRPAFFAVNLARDFGDYAFKASAELGGPKALPQAVETYADELGKAATDILSSVAPRQALAGGLASGTAGAAMGPEDQTLGERAQRGLAYGLVGAGAVGLAGRKIVPTGRAADFLERGGGMDSARLGWKAGQQWFREAQRSGGMVARNPAELARHVGDILKDLALFEPMAQIGNRVELVPRTARMRLAEKAGENATESMIRGRDATVDFARGGEIARSWNKLIPFFNVTVQGGAQIARTLRDHPAAAVTTLVATLGPLMLSTEVYNRATSERAQAYNDVPDYVKDSGIVLMLPWAGSDNRGEKPNYLWIPTGMVTPFVQASRAAMANIPGLEPVNGKGLGETAMGILTMFSPVKGENLSSLAATVVPPIAKQGIELGTNRSTFTGGAIASDTSDERASAFGQAVAGGVNSVGRAVGSDSLQEVRPSQVDYVARQLPAYGDFVLGVSNDMAPTESRRSESRSIQNAPVIGQSAGRIIRDTGGANLERAREEMLSPDVRAVLESVNLPPSTIAPVPARVNGRMLSREEQLEAQYAFNEALADELMRAQSSPKWMNDPKKAVQEAVTRARVTAGKLSKAS